MSRTKTPPCSREGCKKRAAHHQKTGKPLKYCGRDCGIKVADARRNEREKKAKKPKKR